VSAAKAMRDKPRLGHPRHLERRRRYLVGVDIGFGLLAAAAALLLAPGLAIVAVVALALLAVCLVSLGVDGLRSRRG
jgi:hypothetical protein